MPLIVRIARALEPMASSTVVVAREDGQYADLGLATVGDDVPDRGPLGGLARALRHLTEERGERNGVDGGDDGWLLLAPCDWVNPSLEVVHSLLRRARPGTEAVAYRATRWRPLPALYHASIRDRVERQLERGEPALWQLFRALERPVAVPARSAPPVAQANTLEALEAAPRG